MKRVSTCLFTSALMLCFFFGVVSFINNDCASVSKTSSAPSSCAFMSIKTCTKCFAPNLYEEVYRDIPPGSSSTFARHIINEYLLEIGSTYQIPPNSEVASTLEVAEYEVTKRLVLHITAEKKKVKRRTGYFDGCSYMELKELCFEMQAIKLSWRGYEKTNM